MYSLTVEVRTPKACFPFYRYVLADWLPSHLHLILITSLRIGISSIGNLFFQAVMAQRSRPQSPPLFKVYGGSSYSANLSPERVEKLFNAAAQAMGIKHAFVAFHFGAFGRVDFHLLAANVGHDGRELARSAAEFRRSFRQVMRGLVTALNEERLAQGDRSIGNLTPRGRPYFVELPEPEPAPEMAQKAPAHTAERPSRPQNSSTSVTALDARVHIVPSPSESAPLQAPATTSPEINAVLPTRDVVNLPETRPNTPTVDPESPFPVDVSANFESPSLAPSADTQGVTAINTEPTASKPTGQVESLPTDSATVEFGPVPAEIASLSGSQACTTTDSAPPSATSIEDPIDSEFTAAKSAAQNPTPLTPGPSIPTTAHPKAISSAGENGSIVDLADHDGDSPESKTKTEFAAPPPSSSRLPVNGATSVTTTPVMHAPDAPGEPAAEPGHKQPLSSPDSPDSTPSDLIGISQHRDNTTEPIPTEPPSQLKVGSSNRAGEAAAPVNVLAPAKLELHVSNGVQLEPPPAPSNPALESPPPPSSVPPTDLAPPTSTEQPLVPHRPDEPSDYAIAERERKRKAAAAEKERKERADMAADARKLARSRFNWTEQLRLLRAAGRGYQKYLDQPAGPAWAAWIEMAPRTSTSPATLREILLQFLKSNLSANDFKTSHDAAQFFEAIEQICGPIAMNHRQRMAYLAAREFPWESLLVKTIKEHAADAQNPLTLEAGSDWAPLSQHFAKLGEHPTLGTLVERVLRLDPLNAAAAEFHLCALALYDQSYEPKQVQIASRAHDGPELEF